MLQQYFNLKCLNIIISLYLGRFVEIEWKVKRVLANISNSASVQVISSVMGSVILALLWTNQ